MERPDFTAAASMAEVASTEAPGSTVEVDFTAVAVSMAADAGKNQHLV